MPEARGWALLAPHAVWEALLLLLVVVALAVTAADAGSLGVENVLLQAVPLGFVATGLALSVRTGTPNLAVSAIAGLSGIWYADLLGRGSPAPAAVAVALLGACLVGVLLGAVTGLLPVPGWAASLGALFLLQAAALAATDGLVLPLPEAAGLSPVWLLAVVLVSVGGALLWLLHPVRSFLSANRVHGDPSAWRWQRVVAALVGMTGSSALAGVGGVLLTQRLSAAPGDPQLLPLAAAAVLLGGVAVLGRRGGVLGTSLAVVLLSAVTALVALRDGLAYPGLLVGGLAVGVGLLVSAGLEWYHRVLGSRAGTAPRGVWL